MFRSALLLSAAATLTLTAVTDDAFAQSRRPRQGLTVSDTNGNVLLDDGRLDGRGCVVGSRTRFDPATQQLINDPVVRCNFPQDQGGTTTVRARNTVRR